MSVRILHIIGDSKFGGASLGILRLAGFWQSNHWHAEILATDIAFREEAKRRSIPVVPLDAVWRDIRPIRDLKGLYRLYRFLRNNRYDLVHTHTTKAGFVGRIAAFLAGVPAIVHTVHGFAFHERSPWWKIAFYVALERLASLACHRVVTVSNFHGAWGTRLGIAPADKIQAIPNGIPDPAQAPLERVIELRRSLNLQDDEIVVFTPGRLAPEKGLEELVEAASLLRAEGVKFRCVIAGEGPLSESLRTLVRSKGLGDLVTFLGFRDDVALLAQAADILAFPTWREGLSIALLESMAAGRAIVSTYIGSTQEATAEGAAAVLIEPGDARALADAIIALSRDPERRDRLGAIARQIYLERYTVARMLESYYSLYRDLLKEKNVAQSFSTLLPSADR